MEQTYEQMLQAASAELNRVQFALDTDYMIAAQCDETSLLFKSETELDKFLAWTLGHTNIELSRSVVDRMALYADSPALRNLPTAGSPAEGFGVRFEFLQIPGAPFRIECMAVTDGCAPLHEYRLHRKGNGAVIHVSYKKPDLHEYLGSRINLEPCLPFMAEYVNSYGRFAYYSYHGVYVKPRVNLRDHSTAEVVA